MPFLLLWCDFHLRFAVPFCSLLPILGFDLLDPIAHLAAQHLLKSVDLMVHSVSAANEEISE